MIAQHAQESIVADISKNMQKLINLTGKKLYGQAKPDDITSQQLALTTRQTINYSYQILTKHYISNIPEMEYVFNPYGQPSGIEGVKLFRKGSTGVVGDIIAQDSTLLDLVNYPNVTLYQMGYVFEGLLNGVPSICPKDGYQYLPTGKDQQLMAAFYTSQSLSECLVKYSFRALFNNGFNPIDIINMHILEPSAGCASILIEAINQATDLYLAATKTSKPTWIERQKIRQQISANSVGVDLNPRSVEIAELCIALNSITPRAAMTRATIVHGDALIGAYRQTYNAIDLSPLVPIKWYNVNTDLSRKVNQPLPQGSRTRVMPGATRPKGAIYHFLMPDVGTEAKYGEDIEYLELDNIKIRQKWAASLLQPYTHKEIDSLLYLSDKVDHFWHTQHGRTQIKTLMDYWCALWFWPLRESKNLPSREQYLKDMRDLLLLDYYSEFIRSHTGQLVAKIATKRAFLHWELTFFDVFTHGGFDLTVGNPPWIKVESKKQAKYESLFPESNHRVYVQERARLKKLKEVEQNDQK